MSDQLSQILEQIKKYNKIIIHRHQRPDPDAIGSQVGLGEILKASFPYKQVYLVGKHIPGFDWIGTMDDIDGETFNDALVIVTDTANAPRIDDRRFNNGGSSGGWRGALEGGNFMIGGDDKEAFERIRPLFEGIAKRMATFTLVRPVPVTTSRWFTMGSNTG